MPRNISIYYIKLSLYLLSSIVQLIGEDIFVSSHYYHSTQRSWCNLRTSCWWIFSLGKTSKTRVSRNLIRRVHEKKHFVSGWTIVSVCNSCFECLIPQLVVEMGSSNCPPNFSPLCIRTKPFIFHFSYSCSAKKNCGDCLRISISFYEADILLPAISEFCEIAKSYLENFI